MTWTAVAQGVTQVVLQARVKFGRVAGLDLRNGRQVMFLEGAHHTFCLHP